MTDQQAPFNQEAEEAVIGAVLTSPKAYLNIAAFLKPEDFFFVRHEYIWAAIGRLEVKHIPVDTVTLSQELQNHNQLDQLAEVGGPAYFTQLIRTTPTSQHAEVYGGMVMYAAKRRSLMIEADNIKLLATDETLSWKGISEKAEAGLLTVTANNHQQEATDIGTITHEYVSSVEHMLELREQGIMPGLPTGYPSLDNITGGEYKGEFVIIAGPAKSGKSTLNLNIARNRLKMGASIAIVIAEMNRTAIVRKFISMETGIPIRILKNGSFNPQQWSRVMEAASKISKWKLHIIDEFTAPSPLDIRRALRRIMHDEPLDSVSVDGLWLMRSDKPSRKRSEEVGQIMKDMVEITQKLDLRLSMVHQMNRAPGSRSNQRPVLSDLGESIGVEQNASTVIFLYRENYYKGEDADNNELEVIVKATRDGDTGIAKLGFNKEGETYFDLGNVSNVQKQFAARETPIEPVDTNRKDLH